jgi:hypothetical protein
MGVTIENSDSITPGTIAAFSYDSNDIPDGWLVCNGASLNKYIYSNLYNKIKTTYGGGGDYFNLPDYNNGIFLRGINGNAEDLGIVQGDAIRNISGEIYHYKTDDGYSSPIGCFSQDGNGWSGDGTTDSNMPTYNIKFNASNQVPTAEENRPVNMAVVYCIKY